MKTSLKRPNKAFLVGKITKKKQSEGVRKNTLLQTAFPAILPTGFVKNTLQVINFDFP